METEKTLEDIQEEPNLDNSDDNVKSETPKEDNSQDAPDDKIARYKQQIEGSKQEAIKVSQTHKAYREVLKDNTKLLELDEDLARSVVTQLHEDGYATTDSYEDLVAALTE